ncbi:NrfD/PsrC family molybdoenzyme membrane anchor subunit [Eggerthella guodeyinii]|uniref:Polysulfide reductase n=1 Tax=Eggerthella guodeyinii TaxID=2690837 RepID=A0A6N7RSG8_9ACTN|nr:NrfD/PsrC family molybdoenzyme membrane anchor subunit [Eggerthella guodeyinii]MRX83982.1 polysulfide reductase [Eggerthella guodeyinii]
MFNALTIGYLFLGGTGAGALAVLCVLECARALRWRALAMPEEFFARGWPVCTVTLATGILCLLADLGRPDRLLHLLTSPEPSAMAVGSFALAAALVLAAAFSAFALFDTVRLPRVAVVCLAAAGVAAAGATAAYTGVLLESLASVLLWRTPLVPALFVLSSASCGIAVAFLAASFVETRHPYRGPLVWLARVDGGIVLVEAGCLAVFLLLAFAGEGTVAAARALVLGELAPVFWGVLAVCGLAVPLVLERFLTHGNSRTQLLWIAALLLVGGFALRWCIVGAGAYDVTQMPEALYGLAGFGQQG